MIWGGWEKAKVKHRKESRGFGGDNEQNGVGGEQREKGGKKAPKTKSLQDGSRDMLGERAQNKETRCATGGARGRKGLVEGKGSGRRTN